jgi:hypothetical protein
VYEARGVDGAAITPAAELASGDVAEVVIDNVDETVQGAGVSVAPTLNEERYLSARYFHCL